MSRRGREALRSSRDQTGAYGLLLISILISILAAVALGRSPLGRWFVAVLQGLTLLLSLNISGARVRARLTVLALVIIALTVAAIAVALGNTETSRGIDAVISALLVVGAPVAIVRGARNHIEITAQTVFAALSVYLLIGLFFAFSFAVIGTIDQPFFASGVNGSLPDYVYYSYVTLTTVGFGDLIARGDVGRMASVFEAIMGQLYLVTVVALLVGGLISARIRD